MLSAVGPTIAAGLAVGFAIWAGGYAFWYLCLRMTPDQIAHAEIVLISTNATRLGAVWHLCDKSVIRHGHVGSEHYMKGPLFRMFVVGAIVVQPALTMAANIVSNSTGTLVLTVQVMDYVDVRPGGAGTAKVFINFSSAPITTTCANGSTTWRVGGGTDNIKNTLSVATSAKLAGRTVRIYWNSGSQNQCDGSTTGGTSGYPVIMGMELL